MAPTAQRLLGLLLAAAFLLASLVAGGGSGSGHPSHRPPITGGRPGSFLSHTGGAVPSGAGRGIGGSGIVISGRGGAATVATPSPAAPPPPPMAGMPLATGVDYTRHYPAHAVTPLAALKHFSVSEEKGLTNEEAMARCVCVFCVCGLCFVSCMRCAHKQGASPIGW
jgi:hypothetical protein